MSTHTKRTKIECQIFDENENLYATRTFINAEIVAEKQAKFWFYNEYGLYFEDVTIEYYDVDSLSGLPYQLWWIKVIVSEQ